VEPMEESSHRAGQHAATSILLVEDEGLVAQDLAEALTRFGYRVRGIAGEGSQAVQMAQTPEPDLVLMDVGLRGEIDGIQAARLIRERTSIPVIFLTGHSDPVTLQRAVAAGPLGYIVKPFRDHELRCAIEVAMHKHRADVALREREAALRRNAELLENLSLVDDLTQLKNRRGFLELAKQALKVARREQHPLALFFMDLNGLKQINDSLGHLAGDQALVDAAEIIRGTFRDSDILGRWGGDEFVALAHVAGDVEALQRRLRERMEMFNATSQRMYRIELSVGSALVDPKAEETIESLLCRADAEMYRVKRAHRNAS